MQAEKKEKSQERGLQWYRQGGRRERKQEARQHGTEQGGREGRCGWSVHA